MSKFEHVSVGQLATNGRVGLHLRLNEEDVGSLYGLGTDRLDYVYSGCVLDATLLARNPRSQRNMSLTSPSLSSKSLLVFSVDCYE